MQMTRDQLEFAISQYLDGTLPPLEAAALEERLAKNADARELLASYQRLNALMKTSLSVPQIDFEAFSTQLSDRLADVEAPVKHYRLSAGRIVARAETARPRAESASPELRAMRPILLTAVIFLVVPSITRAQQTSALINQQLDQQANLEIKNKPLPQAMKEIANQTGVRIEAAANVYDLLPWGDQTSVTATIKNQTLREGIDAIARKLGLSLVLKDN